MKCKLFILFVICNILLLNNLVAQTSTAFVEAGDAAMLRNDYSGALQYYTEAAVGSADNMQIAWKIAEAARLTNAYSLANTMYQKVANSPQTKKFPLADFWMGAMKKGMGNYKEAKENYLSYLDQPGISEDNKVLANNEIKLCNWAMTVINSPKDVSIEHLGKNVNSPFSEFGAVKKQDTLFFSSLRYENKKDARNPPRLIAKTLETTDTSSSRPIAGFNSDNLHTASLAFSTKQNKVIFCQCEYIENTEQIRCDLFSRVKQGNSWSKPIKLPEHINMPSSSTTQPCLGIDEKGDEVLYFVSNRKEGKGKYDIWYSFVLSDDRYSSPINLAAINTKADEMTPFFHQKNNTLYFSSDGYETLGGLDIYSSLKHGGVFSPAYHLGSPLNSSYNDFYFNIMSDGKEAYFSSNRVGSQFLDKKNETCCYDIYKAKFPEEFLKTVVQSDLSTSKTVNTVGKGKKDTKKSNKSDASDAGKQKDYAGKQSNAADSKTDSINWSTKANKDLVIKKDSLSNYSAMAGNADENANANGKKKPKSYRKSALDAFLPLPLFFDNDEPDNNTKSPTTKKTYQEAYSAYYARKLEYMEKSGKGMQALKKIQTETDMMLFFEKTIQPNFEKLKEFTPILLYRLEKGDQYEIILKGYASPLAKNDYNNYLGQRRVKSLYNFWNTYENGAFEKYFKNGQLKLTLVSFGEETASQSISDDQRNEAASIYSIGAAKERRIEIIEVKGEEK